MSEAWASVPDLSLGEPTEVLRRRTGRASYRPAIGTGPARLPRVRPGELWYVQFLSRQPRLSPLEYSALTTANAVIYDRALAPIVANWLPIGGYAELGAPRDRAAERCLRFTSDGWSVARLVDLQSDWVDDLRHLSARLLRVPASAASSVSVIVNAGGSYQKIEAELPELGDISRVFGSGEPVTMTIIIDGLETGTAPHFVVASANGLAG